MQYNKVMKYLKYKKHLFIFLLLSLFAVTAFPVFAQPFPQQYPPPYKPHPKRDFFPPLDDNQIFLLMGIRISPNFDNLVVADFMFNKILDPTSVSDLIILIDEKPLETNKVLFSKDGRIARIFIKDPADCFSMRISGFKSSNGETMQPVFIDNVTDSTDFYYSREKIWKNRREKYKL